MCTCVLLLTVMSRPHPGALQGRLSPKAGRQAPLRQAGVGRQGGGRRALPHQPKLRTQTRRTKAPVCHGVGLQDSRLNREGSDVIFVLECGCARQTPPVLAQWGINPEPWLVWH